MAKSKGNTSWLNCLARELNVLQFHSAEWISKHISKVNLPRKPVWNDSPSGQSRDVRLQSDPSIERTGEHLEDPADQLLAGEGTDMEVSSLSSGGADELLDVSPVRRKVKPVNPSKPTLHEGRVNVNKRQNPVSHSAVAIRPCAGGKSFAEAVKSGTDPKFSNPVRVSTGPKTSTSGNRSRPLEKSHRTRPSDKSSSEDRYGKKPRLSDPRCPVFGWRGEATRKHALSCHLPGVFDLNLSGDDISKRRLNALKLCSRWLMGAHYELSDLVSYLESLHPQPSEEKPDAISDQAMRDFLHALGESNVPKEFTLKPLGNGVEALVHWRFLLCMVSMLEKEQQENFLRFYKLSEDEKSLLPTPPDGFDSH